MTATASPLSNLAALEGQDLCRLGRAVGTITRGQRNLDKGWATRTVRSAVGELNGVHVIPLRRSRGRLCIKNTLALAAIDITTLVATPFAESTLCAALNEMFLVARADEQQSLARRRSCVLGISHFVLSESSFLYRAVERDYENIRSAVASGAPLSADMGALVQPRTKGRGGDAPRGFAFYARRSFVAHILGLSI
jgi:hypothetical protein